MKDQNNRVLIHNHSKETGSKGHDDQSQQKMFLCTQLFAVNDGVDDAEQKEYDRCHFVYMDTGQGHHDGEDKADQ